MTATHYIEALTARQIHKTLEGRMPAALAKMSTALELTLPNVSGWWWGLASSTAPLPSAAFETPSVGIGLGGGDITGTGSALGSYSSMARYELTLIIDEGCIDADDSASTSQTLVEAANAYTACVWQTLDTWLRHDASQSAASSTSLGKSIPILTVHPEATAPVETTQVEGGALLYVSAVIVNVQQYQHMGTP